MQCFFYVSCLKEVLKKEELFELLIRDLNHCSGLLNSGMLHTEGTSFRRPPDDEQGDEADLTLSSLLFL